MEKTLIQLGPEVRRLVGMILRRPIGESENPSRGAEPAWDSLKHVEIAFLLEDRFGIRLTGRDVANLDDVEQIVKLVEARTCDTTS
jgi:acyl carrier protein